MLYLSQLRCLVAPFSLQIWFSGVTVLAVVDTSTTPTYHNAQACVLCAPRMCLGTGWSTWPLNSRINNTFEWKQCTHHNSHKHLKQKWFKDTEIFPFSQTKCLACQIRDIRDSDLPTRCTSLPREWEDSPVFIPPDKTGCLPR